MESKHFYFMKKQLVLSNGDRAVVTINGKTVSIGVEKITPKQAKKLVDLSEGTNRKTRESVVRQYASEMERGKWYTTGDALRFDASGLLRDGRNRMSALSKCDKPLEFLVVEGIDDNAMSAIDTGFKRSLDNYLQIFYKSYVAGAASIVRAKMVLDKGCIHQGQSESNAGISRSRQVDEYAALEAEYNYAAGFSKEISKMTNRALTQTEVGALYMYLIFKLGWDVDTVKTFFETFGNTPRAEKSLFNTVISLLGNKKECKGAERTKVYIRCWNSWLNNCKANLRSYREGEWFEGPSK